MAWTARTVARTHWTCGPQGVTWTCGPAARTVARTALTARRPGRGLDGPHVAWTARTALTALTSTRTRFFGRKTGKVTPIISNIPESENNTARGSLSFFHRVVTWESGWLMFEEVSGAQTSARTAQANFSPDGPGRWPGRPGHVARPDMWSGGPDSPDPCGPDGPDMWPGRPGRGTNHG